MTYQWRPSNPGMLYGLGDHAHGDRPRLGSRPAQGRQAGKPVWFAWRTNLAFLGGVCKHYQARAPSAADLMVQDDVLIGLPCIWPTAKSNAFPVVAQGQASSCYGKADIARKAVRLRAGIG